MTEVLTGAFESLVSRPDAHVVLDMEPDSQTLLILFGGIAGGVSMPVFEFFRLTYTLPVKKVFLRDPHRSWYQRGIPGIGESSADVHHFLSAAIDRADVDRVVMAGASAGGFAAVLYGAQCGVDEVIAFSPQTFIDADNRRRAGDTRWEEQIAALRATMEDRLPTLDLLDVLPLERGKTRYQVHVSSDDALDLLHAHRISGRGGVRVVEHERGGHRLVKTLRDRGLLQPLLLRALSGCGDGIASTPRTPGST